MYCDSIIFDLDGTLWDAVEQICLSWNLVLKQYPGIRKEICKAELQDCMGLPMGEIAKRLFPMLAPAKRTKLLDACCREEEAFLSKHGGKLYPGVEETLERLAHNHKLLIVSNCQDGYIQSFFAAHHLDRYFCDFECSGVTDLTKGENIRLVIERNRLKASVYVGDTAMDAESAHIANIPFVYACYGFGKVKASDFVIDVFDDLLTLEI